MEWTFVEVWQTVAEHVPDRLALAHGDVALDWSCFDRRAAGIASSLLKAGLHPQEKVALYLHNSPAYMESVYASLKARLVPVNTNYRYTGDELVQLWTDADAVAVIFHGAFAEQADAVRARCPDIKLWLFVDDGKSACPVWAQPYEEAAQHPDEVRGIVGAPSGDDQMLIYTGGTTGLPRGVMWRQHDLYLASNATGDPDVADYDHVRRRLEANAPPVGLPAAPLMHGTGFVFAATILNRGGTVVTLPGISFDVEVLLDTIVAHGVTDLCIVGDAFCRPIVDALDREPGRWNLGHLRVVSSSGMAWSASVKERVLVHAPSALLIDFLNSSEASGMGRSLTSNRKKAGGARFQLGKNACVIDDSGNPLKPGDPNPGRLAVRGHIPLGYYKDPVKTAATFPVVDGVRYSIPGDLATVDSDGAITLLGRGSTSINTGGEKVFPEEVEEAIATWPGVYDSLVVGVPHERFGQMVAAIVASEHGDNLDIEGLRDHLRKRLAGHKIPRAIMPVESIGRGPNGKADRPGITARVIAWLETENAT
ncbi:AMP-binding protein [Tsuneonella sp. YG55]|uniref:AMP-binding protein n=1 Tax=Tsuneonella litorea TaxID=2976475 RepID=A0A9X2VZN0_9SPHN|nr:AMP-binding protein [Tsuneonella litorea]MCT2557514.1 AMP-binding protein [Tsuneonella litorea]